MGLQCREGVRRFHVGNETHIDLCNSAMRQDRFSARACVTADESFNVHCGLGFQPFIRLLPGQIVDPMLHTKLFFRLRFAAHLRNFFNHRLLFGA